MVCRCAPPGCTPHDYSVEAGACCSARLACANGDAYGGSGGSTGTHDVHCLLLARTYLTMFYLPADLCMWIPISESLDLPQLY